jgi:hypothetical protein
MPVHVRTAPRALVLLDPRGAFASVRARPLTGLVLACMLGLALAPPLAFLATNDVAAVVQRELKKSGRIDQLTAEQRETAESAGAQAVKVMLPVGAVGKRALWIGVLAALCFALLRGARPELRFSPVLAALALSTGPLALQDLLAAATFLFKDTASMDLQNVVLSNPAAWFKMETGHSPLAAVLRGLDFFELWACTLAGFGAALVAGARSKMGYVVAFGLHALVVVVGAIAAAAA